MPRCPKCRYVFQVPDGDDPSEHGCYQCGYGTEADDWCVYCNARLVPDDNPEYPFCSPQCAINAEVEEMENV